MIILPDDILFNISESQKHDPNVISEDNSSVKKQTKPKSIIRANKLYNQKLFGNYTKLYYKKLYKFILNKFFYEIDAINQFLLPYVPEELQEKYAELVDTEGYIEFLDKAERHKRENALWTIIKKIWRFIQTFFSIRRWYVRLTWVYKIFKKLYKHKGPISIFGAGATTVWTIGSQKIDEDKKLTTFEKIKLKLRLFFSIFIKPLWKYVRNFLVNWMGWPMDTVEEIGGDLLDSYVLNQNEDEYKFPYSQNYFDNQLQELQSKFNTATSQANNIQLNVTNTSNLVVLSDGSIIQLPQLSPFNNKTNFNLQNSNNNKNFIDSTTEFLSKQRKRLLEYRVDKNTETGETARTFKNYKNQKYQIIGELFDTYIHTHNWLRNIDKFRIKVINSFYYYINNIVDKILKHIDESFKLDNQFLFENANIKLGKDEDRSLKDIKKDKSKIKPVPKSKATSIILKINNQILNYIRKNKFLLLINSVGYRTNIKNINGTINKMDNNMDIYKLLKNSNSILVKFITYLLSSKEMEYNPADISNNDGKSLFKFDEAIKNAQYDILDQEKLSQMNIKNTLFYEVWNRIMWINKNLPSELF